MEVSKENIDGKIVLHPNGEMDIYAVSRFREDIIDALANSNQVAINLEGVMNLDTAGFQLLISAKRAAATRGATLHLFGHTDKILQIFALYGAVGLLGDKIRLTSEQKSALSFRYGLKKQNIEAGNLR